MSKSAVPSGTAVLRVDQPSHDAIDNFNSDRQDPKYMVLDDLNVDLITTFTVISSAIAILILRFPALQTVIFVTALLLPLRTFFPKSTKPEGLALITGASSGIGAELAYVFARNGHDLILVGRNEEQLDAVRKNIKTNAHVVVTDLSVPGAPRQLYDHVISQGYVVDILVNNAGLGHAGDVMHQPEELAERMIGLNCIALVVLTQLFGKNMVERRRGWILEVSSIVGWMAGPGQNIYHATKHLVRAFSEALSVELRGTGVHLTQLMPGPVHTQFGTRGHLEKTFTFSSSGIVEDAKSVAEAGYSGLCKSKRMVFSSWNAAATAMMFHLMPRSLHLTLGSIMNSPTPNTEMTQPKKQQ